MTDDFVKVALTREIKPGQMKAYDFNKESICIINDSGNFYAISNICTHEGGPLADGTLENFEVECPWHNARFDIRTGEALTPPASKPVLTYETMIKDEYVMVKKNLILKSKF